MLGEKIKQLRRVQNMTQKELAAAINVSLRTLINYEMGSSHPRQPEVISRLAEVLGVSVSYLFAETDDDDTIDGPAKEAKRMVRELSVLFAGGQLSVEDREAAIEAIMQAYLDGRRTTRNKKKKEL